MYTEPSTTNALPKLPGFNFDSQLSQPHTFAKSHALGWNKGVRQVKDVAPATGLPPVRPQDVPPAERNIGLPRTRVMAAHPQWRSLQDKALRFFGYFVEEVEESLIEKSRVRKVVITYGLHDATLSVTETPAVANSGLRHGSIMGKHYDPSVTLADLYIGDAVTIRGRQMFLVDCDAFTREFYETMGIPQPAGGPLDYPTDRFELLQTAPRKIHDAEQARQKRANEALAAAATGKVASFMTPEEREKAKSFYAHDREVLSFSATWDSRTFRVNYYIADGTLQVANVQTANNGRDPNLAFIKRAKVPKGAAVHKALDTVSAPPTSQYYTAEDLRTGESINILGRDFYLYSCDAFTQQYYRENFGVDQPTVEKPPTEGDPNFMRPQLAKGPKKPNNYAKFQKMSGDVLRFAAELYNAAPEDAGRQFILCYYLGDDTATVYEFTVRNSGHPGGKVFSRAKVPTVDPDTLAEGAIVTLGGFTYILKEADERTRLFRETGESIDNITESANALILRLRDAVNTRWSRTTEAYRHYNTHKRGIGLDDLQNMFRECEIRVPDKAVLMRVMDELDADRDGVLSLQEFVDNLLKQTISYARMPPPQNEAAVRSYQEVRDEQNRKEAADRVLKLFISKLEARRVFIVDTFRIISDRSVDGLIGVEAFKEGVQGRLALGLTPDELDALVYRFFYIPGLADYLSRRLTLREFRKIVEA